MTKKIFLYETSPLDYWEGWHDFEKISYFLHHNLQYNSCEDSEYKSAHDIDIQIFAFKTLLLNGLVNFHKYFKNDFRSYNIKLNKCFDTESIDDPFPGEHEVVALKVNTNGICYAFSYSNKLIIPHDYDEMWSIVDMAVIN